MGFFFVGKKATQTTLAGLSKDLLHRKGCDVCPLNVLPGNKTPHMKPAGSRQPVVYMLGEAPGRNEDAQGKPFVGDSGRALRMRIPAGWNDDNLRWSNVVRTRPPDNRNPTQVEIECCRPSIIKDIEETQPLAVFGFGGIPLHWATGMTGITSWAGRRVPVRIGQHTCWYFPMLHPSYVIRSRKGRYEPRNSSEYGSDIEFSFALDVQRGFDAVSDGLPEPVIHTKEDALAGIEIVTGHGDLDVDIVQGFLMEAAELKIVGVDYETNALRPYSAGAKMLTVAISTSRGTLAIALDHPQAGWSEDDLNYVYELLSWYFHEAPCLKVAHQAPFEIEWSVHTFGVGAARSQPWGDTLAQAYVLQGGSGALSLEELCLQHFGINIKAIDNTDRKNLEKERLETVLRYNGVDAKYHRLLYLAQFPILKQQGLVDQYNHILGRAATMVLCQRKGVPVNQDTVTALQTKYAGQQADALAILQADPAVPKYEKIFKEPYEPGSNPKTLKLFDAVLGMKLDSVDVVTLTDLKHPIAKKILNWRTPGKVLSTYIEPCLPDAKFMYPDGMLHPIIKHVGTRTTRTSSEAINIQNWPKRNEHTAEIRNIVEVAPGYKIYAFDYAGIQARNVAMESKDEALIDAFWHDYDVHTDWRERIIKHYPKWKHSTLPLPAAACVDNKKLAKDYRHLAKNKFVFPAFFGALAKALASYLEIPEDVATKVLDEFWTEFPNIKKWHERLFRNYRRTGYVTGLSGMRRHAPISPNEIINSPIQADEAFIVCSAMERLSIIAPNELTATFEIHDDLTFIWPEDRADAYIKQVAEEMTRPAWDWINVPLVVELSVGTKWGELKEIDKFSSETIWDHKRA